MSLTRSEREELKRELKRGAAARRERQKKMDSLSPEERATLAREAVRRLLKLGGSMPDFPDIHRRRPPSFLNE
jgi:hypothetical protein